MNIGPDAVEQIVRRAISAGAAAVVVILGPTQGAAPPPGQAAGQVTTATATATVTPTATPTPFTAPPPTPDPTGQPDPATAPRSGRATARPGRTTTTSASTTTAPTTTHLPATAPPDDDLTTTPDPTRTSSHKPSRTRSAERTTGSATADDPTTEPSADAPDTGSATGGTSAAATQGWGTPTRVDDFDAGTEAWQLYDGPGNNGTGHRAPGAVSVQDGLATIGGDASGTTGGMCWGVGRRFGRWEARLRAPAADPSYHAVALLWPDGDHWPAGGEIDFMELLDPARHTAQGFVHHGADNRVAQASVTTDATRWHDWAVDWAPSSITMYLDGRPWYRTTSAALQPPGPMHLCVQLDWFPTGGPVRPSTLQVDWAREYGPAPAGAATPSGAPAGASGTGASRAGGD